jgi:hypothetical protein
MLIAVQFACSLPKADADALNQESGRIYSDMLVSHSRLYRKQGVWLAPNNEGRWEDLHGGLTTLQEHRRDALAAGLLQGMQDSEGVPGRGPGRKVPP